MRSSSLKWSLVNGLVLLLFVYDLSRPCGAPLSALQWCEGALAAVAAANLALHAARALRPRDTHAPRDPRTPRDPRAPRDSYTPRPTRESEEASSREEALSLSLSPRAWRPAESPPSPHSSPHPSPHSSPHPSPHSSPHPSPHSSPHSPPSPRSARVSHDRFIADRHALENYLREYEARRGAEGEGREEAGQAAARGGPPTPAGPRGAPAPYQLAATDAEGEESGGGGGGGGGGGAGGAEGACVWRRLHLDPRRLAQYNFNLRLWIQVTIVQRLVRELERVERALSPPEPIEDMSVERLRSVAGGVAAYVEPWADVRHVVRRWRAWARAPALSAWRGDAPAAAASPQRPSDADLLLHLVATYLDGQLADAAHPRPFSAAHLCVGAGEGEAGPPPHPRRLALQRRGARWALLAGEAALEVGAGRNAPLHALLLLLAAAARRTPPALHTTHLGPAGLNMLWIIGR